MKKTIIIGSLLLVIIGVYVGWSSISEMSEKVAEYVSEDPDRPPGMEGEFDEAEYKANREAFVALLRGVDPSRPVDSASRIRAVEKLEEQANRLGKNRSANDALLQAWTELGPNPIPNGQTQTTVTPVS